MSYVKKKDNDSVKYTSTTNFSCQTKVCMSYLFMYLFIILLFIYLYDKTAIHTTVIFQGEFLSWLRCSM